MPDLILNKLLPCPFCGEDDDLEAYESGAGCGNCGAHTGSMMKTIAINTEIWNTQFSIHPLDENLLKLLSAVTEVTECLVLDSMKIPSFTKRRIELLAKVHSEIQDSKLIFKNDND